MAGRKDKPKWIWTARGQHAVDGYLRARRSFRLRSRPVEARLEVTAFSEYVLYVNGRQVGRGPAPSGFASPQSDVYTEADLPLRRGRNVVAVLAHNYHVGLARLPRTPAGLWLRLQVTCATGARVTVATDRRWRVEPAEDFNARAPRVHWTTGFAEVRDTRLEPAGWTEAAFDDRRWRRADEVRLRGHGVSGRPQPVERRAPRLFEEEVRPARVQSVGRLRMKPGVTAIPFEFNILTGAAGEFYAATFVYSAGRKRARLLFDCDEAAAVYVNNRQALRQGYDEAFVHWLGEEEHDDFPGTGIHRGQGRRVRPAEVDLEAGWNSLGVVLYGPESAWGFAMAFENPRTGRPMKVEFSPDRRRGDRSHWFIVTEELCPCSRNGIPETLAPNARTFPDPAFLVALEKRSPSRKAARQARALLARPKGKGPLVLPDGSYVRYDFGREVVGRVAMEVRGQAGAILDLAWSEGIGGTDAAAGGMRRADRLVLRGGWQEVCFVNRRALRCLELVCRSGDAPIEVRRIAVEATTALEAEPAILKTADRRLERVWALCRRTARACFQQTLEGSPGREAEQSIASAYLLGEIERIALGRTDRGEAALRAFAADQDEEGFFRALVPAGTRHAIPDWNLLWVVWLAEHVAWTGDRRLAEELLPAAERCLDWIASFRGPSGLLENKPDREGWWLMLDLSPMDKRGEVTAWQALYVRALEAAAGVARWLGRETTAARLGDEAETMRETARDRLWDGRVGRFVDARLFENLSESAGPATNYYALWGGLATSRQADRMLENLWSGETEAADWGEFENPYVKRFALEALLGRGEADRAVAMVRGYWGAMAEARLAAVPEMFRAGVPRAGEATAEGDFGPNGRRLAPAGCHGWGAYPEALVARWVLGVHPEEPGFEPARLAPMPGGLVRVSGSVWTPKGRVRVAIGASRGRRQVRVEVPEGMRYRLDRRHLEKSDEVQIVGGEEAG
ncbi:MAG: alpha-L-rhamnosidase N-terminal domain-containing protein [Phycisphaerae bacterium]